MRPVSAHRGTPTPAYLSRGARCCVLAAVVVTLMAGGQSVSAQGAQTLRVFPLVRGEQVEVSFELRDGFTPEVKAAIHSGLKTTFTYNVDLRVDAAGWIDRTIGSSVITISVQYDNLAGIHKIEHRVDGRIEKTTETKDENVVRQWLTSLQGLQLFPTSLLERNREYYVRVYATARPSHGALLWPFGSGTSAQAKFTFIR
jgi:hypothetical protein